MQLTFNCSIDDYICCYNTRIHDKHVPGLLNTDLEVILSKLSENPQQQGQYYNKIYDVTNLSQ